MCRGRAGTPVAVPTLRMRSNEPGGVQPIISRPLQARSLSTSCLSSGRLTPVVSSSAIPVAPATISVPPNTYQALPWRRQLSPRPLSPTRTRVLSPRLSSPRPVQVVRPASQGPTAQVNTTPILAPPSSQAAQAPAVPQAPQAPQAPQVPQAPRLLPMEKSSGRSGRMVIATTQSGCQSVTSTERGRETPKEEELPGIAVLKRDFDCALEEVSNLLRCGTPRENQGHSWPDIEERLFSAAGPLPPPHNAVPPTRLIPHSAVVSSSLVASLAPGPVGAVGAVGSVGAMGAMGAVGSVGAVGFVGAVAVGTGASGASVATLACPETPNSVGSAKEVQAPVASCPDSGSEANKTIDISTNRMPFAVHPSQAFFPSSARSSSRPRSPKHEELYVEAAARRERHQERLAQSMLLRQQSEADEQLRWQGERLAWQASYKGPQDFKSKSHADRELELLQKRQSWQERFEVQQTVREKQELQECTFWPDTSRSNSSFRASRNGSLTRSSNGLPLSRDGSRLLRNPSTASRSSSRGMSPRDDTAADLVALYDKQVLVLRRLSVICASAEPSGDDGSRKSRLSTAGDLVASAAEGPERLKTELKLYRQQLEQVHVLERLDMVALELSAERLRYLVSLGYKLGIAEELRSKLQKPGSANLPPAGAETRQDPEESTQDELLSASSPTCGPNGPAT